MQSNPYVSNPCDVYVRRFEGVSVRVRRPNDYNPAMAATLGPSTPNPNLNLAAIGLNQPGAVADGPDRIFVRGLPYYGRPRENKRIAYARKS